MNKAVLLLSSYLVKGLKQLDGNNIEENIFKNIYIDEIK